MGFLLNRIKDDKGSGAYHSTAYHDFFEGYTEQKIDVGGKKKLRRVYTGQYYAQQLTDRGRRLNKLAMAGLFLLGAAGLIGGAAIPGEHNLAWYTQLPVAFALVMLFWLLYVLLQYLAAAKKQTVGDWRATAEKLPRAARLTSDAMLLAALLQLLFWVLNPETVWYQPLLSAVCLGLGGGAVLLMRMQQESIVYTREDSAAATSGGIEIKSMEE